MSRDRGGCARTAGKSRIVNEEPGDSVTLIAETCLCNSASRSNGRILNANGNWNDCLKISSGHSCDSYFHIHTLICVMYFVERTSRNAWT